MINFKVKLSRPKNKRYSIMIVPEGSQPVMRFKFSSFYFIAGSIAVVGILLTTLVLFYTNQSHSQKINTLQAKLDSSSDELKTTMVNKDQAMDELLSQLLELSEQSKNVESKMAELQTLEAELKQMTNKKEGNDGAITSFSTKQKDLTSPLSSALDGVGGEDIEMTPQNIAALIEQTKQSIANTLQTAPALQSSLEKTKHSVKQYQTLLATTPTYWPTVSTRITSHFGSRKDPFTGRVKYHGGLDVGGEVGDPIYAAADGKVTDAGVSTSRGNYIVISHPSGLQSHYMHLNAVSTTTGTTVKQGEVIGELGNTGRSTGPHLHFEIVKDGVLVDPADYISPNREEVSN